jgi:polysaccharide export outer membrane protein
LGFITGGFAGVLERGLMITMSRTLMLLVSAFAIAALVGCAALPPNSFLDPTIIGSFPSDFRERGIRRVLTPREAPAGLANAVEPTAEDLVPDMSEYRIGRLDTIAIQINDFIVPGFPESAVLEVTPSGYIRLPDLGAVKVLGMTEQEVEQELKARLVEQGILTKPIVRCFIQNKRENYCMVIGSVSAAGAYAITSPDMRLLELIGLARDIAPGVKKLYVIRQAAGTAGYPAPTAATGAQPQPAAPAAPKPAPRQKSREDEGLVIPPPDENDSQFRVGFSATSGGLRRAARASAQETPPDMQELGAVIDPTHRTTQPATQATVSGQPRPERPFEPLILDPQTGETIESRPPATIEAPAPRLPAPPEPADAQQPFSWEEAPEYETAQRVIEIDVSGLKRGDSRQNIVIRPRDVINVPVDIGVFYLMGEVNRPGVYGLNDREITLKQAMAIAGGLAPLAWPQRVEIIRREPGTDKQITIPVDLDAIFAGLQDDVLLKDDDIVNVGSHVVAPFLFVIRNSFRFTYGFGFVYDRNYADQDAYNARPNPQALEDARRAARGLPF